MQRIEVATLLRGPEARAALTDGTFIAAWTELHRHSPHATAFQAPAFACAWYSAYAEEWEPVIVITSRDGRGGLVGLWALAYRAADWTLVHVGAHQAEYHAWLAQPSEDAAFLATAWTAIRRDLPFRRLQCKYLPAPHLADTLAVALGRNRVAFRRHARPLAWLDTEDIRASFAKKSNKSRFNRLKRLGALEFRRITQREELEAALDALIDFYDFRQGAVNRSVPFREDPRKRAFHLALFEAAGEDLVFTATLLDGHPIAGFWGLASGAMAHLGMLIHSPFLAEHSPGKLHVMQLSERLLEQGRTALDLTPGGDAWKERFANDHDEVAEALLYASSMIRLREAVLESMGRAARNLLSWVRITPAQARTAVALLSKASPARVVRKLRAWAGENREFRVYRADRALARRHAADPGVRCNDLADLLLFQPCESWQSRDSFLSAALERLEQGQSAFTISLEGKLAHCGWMAAQSESRMSEVEQTLAFPEGSVALYDYYTPPSFRGRGLDRTAIGHMLWAAFQRAETRYAYISVLADNGPSRHVIEGLGFELQGVFHWRRRFGQITKWADAFPEEAGDA